MSNDKVLMQVVKGAGLLFFGTLFVYIIKFIYRIIVSRYLGPSDYGLLSLGDGIFNIISLLAMLGLSAGGAVKFVSHYLGRNQLEKVKGTIISVFKVTIPFSILITILTIVFSQYISIGIFKNSELVPIVVIFSLAVPFYIFSNICANIFIAFKKVQYRNYLTALTRPISSIILIFLVVLFKGNIFHIALSFLISHILPFFLGFYLLEFKTFSLIKSKFKAKYNLKELISYSLPLFLSGFFLATMGWIDSFFLGALKTTYDVGIYSIALSLVSTLTIFISAFGKIYFPISSKLYAKKEYSRINSIYSSISRWIFLLCLPLFIIILIFAKDILVILFGSAYGVGAVALQILILAYLVKGFVGPAPEALMTLNKTKLLFYVNSIMAVLNMIFNYFLIPLLGVMGAAIATSSSIIIRECIFFLIVKCELNFSFDLKIYTKYFISALIPSFLIYFTKSFFNEINLIILIMLIIIYGILYGIFLRLLLSFTDDDLFIVNAIEKKTKVNLSFIKKFINIKK
jgi:O-antigen/teichoic acid export membrane protein